MGSKPPISISVPKEELAEVRELARVLIGKLIGMGADVTSQSALFRAAVKGELVTEDGQVFLKIRVK